MSAQGKTGAVTPGPWKVVAGDDYMVCSGSMPREWPHAFGGQSTGDAVAYVGNHAADFGQANARLIADAGTVLHETGKMPRELANEVTALTAQLAEVREQRDYYRDRPAAGDVERLTAQRDALLAASNRVTAAFRALWVADGVANNFQARRECEHAMAALFDAAQCAGGKA